MLQNEESQVLAQTPAPISAKLGFAHKLYSYRISRIVSIAFGFLGALFMAVTCFSWYGLHGFQGSMRTLSETTLPQAMDTADNAMQVSNLLVYMERLTHVDSETEHRIVYTGMQKQLDKLSRTLWQENRDNDRGIAQLEVLQVQIGRLNELVGERLELEKNLYANINDLSELATKIFIFPTTLKSNFSSNQMNLLRNRSAVLSSLLMECQNNVLGQNRGRPNQISRKIRQEIAKTKKYGQYFADADFKRWELLLAEAELLLLDKGGYIDTLTSLLRAKSAIISVNSTARGMMDDLNSMQVTLFNELSHASGQELSETSDKLLLFTQFFVAIGSIALLSILGVYTYFHNALLVRILKLNNAVLAKVAGEEVSIDTQGSDEIATIAQSINYFSTETQKSMELAKASNKAKSEFLANMSHEIRTPLNAIIGFSRMMGDTTLSTQQQNYIEKINTSARFLLGLINDTLDFSKIEAGKLTVEKIVFGFKEMIEGVSIVASSKAKFKNLNFTIKVDPKLPAYVKGDPLRTSQILNNLADNAIKFTAKGNVIIDIVLVEQQAENCEIRFTVTDEGIGLSEEQINAIFQPFTQADSSTTRFYGGTGLGLTICQSLAELLGGKIVLESEPNKGSSFSFTLPFEVIEQDVINSVEPSEQKIPDLRNKFLLLVEDNLINQEIALALLEPTGAHIDVAVNGKEAIELVKLNYYDLVLMDIQMPEMDGITATEHILQLSGAICTHLPIIAMTANAMDTDRRKSFEAGMVDHVIKPIEPAILYQVINKWIL